MQNRDGGGVCKIPFGALGQEDSQMSKARISLMIIGWESNITDTAS